MKFPKRIADLPSDIWQKICKIDELKKQWSIGVHLDQQILKRLKKSVIITSTGASTRIEGARLSDEDVERLMRGIVMQKFQDRDKQEVQGYYELITNVFDSYSTMPFSESTIKFFHRELLKHVEKDALHRGEYKKKENKVAMVDASGKTTGIIFDTTPAYLTPKAMQELVEWTQEFMVDKQYHPLLVIGNFIVEFLMIHPFEDGNGRLSRILANLLLLQHGYLYMPYVSQEKLIGDRKPEYYMALRQSQKTFGTKQEDIKPWLEFFLSVILEQSKQAIALISEEQIDKLLSKQQQTIWRYLEKVTEATPLEISQATEIPRPTVSQALSKLLKLKKVERIGVGRSTRYRKL